MNLTFEGVIFLELSSYVVISHSILSSRFSRHVWCDGSLACPSKHLFPLRVPFLYRCLPIIGFYGQGIIRVVVNLYLEKNRAQHLRLLHDGADNIPPDSRRLLWLLCMSRIGNRKSQRKDVPDKSIAQLQSNSNARNLDRSCRSTSVPDPQDEEHNHFIGAKVSGHF